MTDLEPAALEALARAFDREDAAQRGEPDPWLDGADDAEWVSERLACAQVAEAAYLATRLSVPEAGKAVDAETQFSLRQIGEIDFDGMEGRERINGVVLEGDAAAVRSVAALIGEKVCVVSATALAALSAKLVDAEKRALDAFRIGIAHQEEHFASEADATDFRRKLEEARKALEEGIEQYFARQIEWSRETFGPALRTRGVIDHIRKELTEIEADPHDLSEWIDVVILAMDGFWRHGGSASDLMPRLLAKQQKNMARSWPDWRTMSEDHAIEHNRAESSHA